MKPHRVNTVVTIFCEGDTEEEFYPKLIQYIRQQRGGMLDCRIEVKNLKGIGNYQSKLNNYFKNKILVDNKRYIHKVALCYDTDVFQGYKIKPVDWTIIEKELRRNGADEIIHVRAERTIEDWFLLDTEGLRTYLNKSKDFNMTGYKGLKGLKKLLKTGGKEYKKGKSCDGLIDALSLEVILPKIQDDIGDLLRLLR